MGSPRLVLATAPGSGEWRGGRFVLWAGLSLLLAALVAWVSVAVQKGGFAPLGLYGVLVGAALAAGLVGLARWLQVAHRPSGLALALACALCTIGLQHLLAYRDYLAERARWSPDDPRAAAAFDVEGPPSLWSYLASSGRGGRASIWLLNAALLAATTAAGVAVALRRPFCNTCHSWYRAVRSGTLPAAAAQHLAAAADLPPPPATATPLTYRLTACATRCGPIRLELSWKEPAGPRHQTAWIASASRPEVERILDEAGGRSG